MSGTGVVEVYIEYPENKIKVKDSLGSIIKNLRTLLIFRVPFYFVTIIIPIMGTLKIQHYFKK